MSTMMTFAQCWCHYTSGQEESTSPSAHTQESMNLVFANQDDEEAIYPLTTREIAEAQKYNFELNTILINVVIPHSSLRIQKHSVKTAKWQFQQAYNILCFFIENILFFLPEIILFLQEVLHFRSP
jgi:hypothetical protein